MMVNQPRQKMATGMKSSVSNLRVLLCPCVVRKETTHVDKKELNMLHQPQKVFKGIYIGIPQHQKGYLIYIPSTRKIVSSHGVVFEKLFLVCYHTRHIHIQRHLL